MHQWRTCANNDNLRAVTICSDRETCRTSTLLQRNKRLFRVAANSVKIYWVKIYQTRPCQRPIHPYQYCPGPRMPQHHLVACLPHQPLTQFIARHCAGAVMSRQSRRDLRTISFSRFLCFRSKYLDSPRYNRTGQSIKCRHQGPLQVSSRAPAAAV